MPGIPTHPAFPQPHDFAAKLWRYLDTEKFAWMVENGRLLMPSASKLGDPLEGTRPDGDRAWWQQQIDQSPSEDKRRVLKYNRDTLQRFTDNFREHYYVSCWHLNEAESMEMWCCYVKGSESVVVQTRYSILRKCLANFIEIGLVRYIDYRKEKLPSLNLYECVTHKDIVYEFEKEVRAVVQHPPPKSPHHAEFMQHFFESESKKDFRAFAPEIELSSFIETIVLHPKATREFVQHTNRLCRENGVNEPMQSKFSRV